MNAQTFAVTCIAAIALAGCVTPTEALPAEADLSYDGSSNGDHSDKADCDADATLSGTGDVDDGALSLRVTDAQDDVLFAKTYDGSIRIDAHLEGHAGTWTMTAERLQDDVLGDEFSGSYALFLDCQAF